MTVFTKAVRSLNRGLQKQGGESVTYRRGNESITELSAVPANTRHDDYGEEGTAITARERDWIIWATALVNQGTVWTPQRGDEIDYTDPNGNKRTFQVLPRADDRCYRHTDQTMQQFRVYTVESLPSVE